MLWHHSHKGKKNMEKKPLDPETREFLNAMSRRRLLQVGAIGGAAAVATACGVGSSSPSPTKVKDLSDKEKFFNWSTWIDYIDIDDAGNYPTLEIFQEQTGIKVEYKEDTTTTMNSSQKFALS
jgi:spermidine/putrescine transport system substrate-binding protein